MGMLDDMLPAAWRPCTTFKSTNALLDIADPVFIGLHRSADAQISVKVCEKRDPDEGLGVVVRRGGRYAMVEYTELTRDQKHERLADGTLRFRYGSVAIHVFSLEFLRQESLAELPLHVAHKKWPTAARMAGP